MTCSPHKVVLHLLILASLAASSNAQTAGLIGRKIVEIRYSPPRVLSPEDLEEVQPLKKGAVLRAQDVSDAIDRLFATGRFEDIVAEAEPSGEGVIVRFVTTPAFFIGGVSVAGKISESPNRGEVASTGTSYPGLGVSAGGCGPGCDQDQAAVHVEWTVRGRSDTRNRQERLRRAGIRDISRSTRENAPSTACRPYTARPNCPTGRFSEPPAGGFP